MSKIKKAAAVVATAVLCMSMSMGVFASSPTDPEIPNIMWGEQSTENDSDRLSAYVSTYKDVSEEVEKILQDEDQVKEILYEAGYTVKDGDEIKVIAASDVELYDGTSSNPMELPEGGVDLDLVFGEYEKYESGREYTYGNIADLKEGDTVYVLHQKDDGTWEVMEGTVRVKTEESYGNTYTSYYVTAHFDTLSPVAIIKVMSNGEVVVLDKNENYKGTIDVTAANKGDKVEGESSQLVKTTAEKKSPKTGN